MKKIVMVGTLSLLICVLVFNFCFKKEEIKQDVYYGQVWANALNRHVLVVKTLIGTWKPMKVSMTQYAPLDPSAIEGMCFEGDPNITASGAKSNPGTSIAMGKNIPFGTEVYIPGFGKRIVHDRGGMIKDNNLDLMVTTSREANAFGRQRRIVFVKTGGGVNGYF